MFMLPEVIYRFDAITNKIYQWNSCITSPCLDQGITAFPKYTNCIWIFTWVCFLKNPNWDSGYWNSFLSPTNLLYTWTRLKF
jgi:hypothetical protein